MAPAKNQDRVVLNSWKEIAVYVGRGVRTMQRWERELHLPVHRPAGKGRSAVLAFSDEIDRWLRNTSSKSPQSMQATENLHNFDGLKKLQVSSEEFHRQVDILRGRLEEFQRLLKHRQDQPYRKTAP